MGINLNAVQKFWSVKFILVAPESTRVLSLKKDLLRTEHFLRHGRWRTRWSLGWETRCRSAPERALWLAENGSQKSPPRLPHFSPLLSSSRRRRWTTRKWGVIITLSMISLLDIILFYNGFAHLTFPTPEISVGNRGSEKWFGNFIT